MAQMKRREFIILNGIGAASAGLLSACGHPENKLIPALIPDDEYIPGIDYWKASACALCPAGCGIVVRTREQKANKIEGNPLHPVNRGALCARGQAGLQALYNPDRIRAPLKRTSSGFQQISWDEAIRALAEPISGTHPVVFISSDAEGVTGLVAERLASSRGWRLARDARPSEAPTAEDYSLSYGRATIPIFDIANATYLLSFGARFLETWHSPVMYSLAYGEFRRGANRARGRFVQIEPRMSLTAANADQWLPASVGSEGLIALAMAHVIAREKLPNSFREPLNQYAPEKIADRTDIPADVITRIAREFASSERPLAIIGGASALSRADNIAAVNYLNALAGNINKPGGVILSDGFDPFRSMRRGRPNWNELSAEVISGTSAVLIHRSNPAYYNPKIAEAIRSAPFIASFATFLDETAMLADLVLPDHSYLESWDLISAPSKGSTAIAIMRPVVQPEFDTRQAADVLIALARQLGDVASELESAEAIVKRAAAELRNAQGSIAATSDEEFWAAFLERGVVELDLTGPSRSDKTPKLTLQKESLRAASAYPLTLITYEHLALGFGELANLPWLQELPDPMTSVMWDSWIEINPKTASELGLSEGDLVEVQSELGTLRAPAVIYPAIRPDVIAMPCGQGHGAYGRYAAGRGANPLSLWPRPLAIGARVSKLGIKVKLARFGTNLPERLEVKR
jgi:anaerobic selenocysteine-containing dehydrogenase